MFIEGHHMPKSKAITVRPVSQLSILDKKFKKTIEVEKPVHVDPAHPFVVISDLKRGSLKSLAHHLRKSGSIADPDIAAELLKLITGSVTQTPFKIIVIDHPEKANVGGRPKAVLTSLSEKEKALVAHFDVILETEKKHDLALGALAKDAGVSRATISRALRKRRHLIERDDEVTARAARLEGTNVKRKAGLDKLRQKSGG